MPLVDRRWTETEIITAAIDLVAAEEVLIKMLPPVEVIVAAADQ
jgi:hypothetical protein